MFYWCKMNQIESDKKIIESHGGATALANLLSYQVQRVQNWKTRGIPASEKLKHPNLFLKKKTSKVSKASLS